VPQAKQQQAARDTSRPRLRLCRNQRKQISRSRPPPDSCSNFQRRRKTNDGIHRFTCGIIARWVLRLANGPGHSLAGESKRWALVIGVDKYTDPQISPLKGSDNDARLIADALVRYAGFRRTR